MTQNVHIEDVPPSHEQWDVKVRSAAKLAETLRDNTDAAMLYRDLATLRHTAEIPESLDELEWRGVHKAEFITLCDELGFGSVRGRPSMWSAEPIEQ